MKIITLTWCRRCVGYAPIFCAIFVGRNKGVVSVKPGIDHLKGQTTVSYPPAVA